MKSINIMLHMKLRNAVCTAALLAFLPSSFLFVSPAQAGVCFLPDCPEYVHKYDNVNSDTKWCEDNGYYFTCPDGTAADYAQPCSRDETYTKCTEEQWCKNKGYDKTFEYCQSQGPTWYPDEDKKCPNGQDLYQECKEDSGRACEEDNKFMTCTVGRPSKNDSEFCEWNSNYAECCTDTPSLNCPADSQVEGCEDGEVVGKDSCGYECRQCCVQTCPTGYDYTDEQTSGGEGGYIKDGDDYCNHCTRGKLYKRKENPCTGYDVCSAYGGVDNGDYCYSGSLKKYSECLTECRPGYVEWCDTPVTDCATLGYTKTAAECSGLSATACPFNKDKWFCEKKDYSGIPTSGFCCGYTNYCGYSGGTSSSDDSHCQSIHGKTCYELCKSSGLPDCNDMQASCRAQGGTLSFQDCSYYGTNSYVGIVYATFSCD